jgi:hypothetical protein
MLFDEPTSALDTEFIGEVLAVMRASAPSAEDGVHSHSEPGQRPRLDRSPPPYPSHETTLRSVRW